MRSSTLLCASVLAVCAAFVVPFVSFAASNVGVEEAVRQSFIDIPVLIQIADCESKFTMFSGDKALSGGSGGMIGVFQINARVHADAAASMGMNIYTLNGNLAYARYLYTQEGVTPWLSSASCWKKKLLISPASSTAMQTSATTTTTQQENSQEIARLRDLIIVLTQELQRLQRLRGEFAAR